jgi:hypothetical protein
MVKACADSVVIRLSISDVGGADRRGPYMTWARGDVSMRARSQEVANAMWGPHVARAKFTEGLFTMPGMQDRLIMM